MKTFAAFIASGLQTLLPGPTDNTIKRVGFPRGDRESAASTKSPAGQSPAGGDLGGDFLRSAAKPTLLRREKYAFRGTGKFVDFQISEVL